jgi:streptomycin 6-kinase
VAERELDLAVALRELTDGLAAGDAQALARSGAKLLAALTGTDPEAIWEWGVAAGRLHIDAARRWIDR